MRWRRSADDGDRGALLEGTSSELVDFGSSGSDGFAQAWDSQSAAQAHEDDLTRFGPPDDDKRARRARDLDRRSRRGVFALGAIVLVGAAAAFAVQQGVVSDPTGLAPDEPLDINVIASIDDPREYSDEAAVLAVDDATPVDSPFIGGADSDPTPVTELADVTRNAAFAPLFWGGRSHVAVVGSGLDLETTCVVVTLAAEDLRVIDLAAHGACGDRYSASGDRIACVGDDIVLLEVWPYDPDAVVDKPDVHTARVRLEQVDPDTAESKSVRGSAPLDDQVLENAARLGGRPGDEARVQIGASSATCTLVDRAEVRVQLL